jgi:hypothetical protein
MQTLIISSVNRSFQITLHNWFYAPIGRIHIARFRYSFDPSQGRGYYGDIYLRLFIRKWKKYVKTKRDIAATKISRFLRNIYFTKIVQPRVREKYKPSNLIAALKSLQDDSDDAFDLLINHFFN